MMRLIWAVTKKGDDIRKTLSPRHNFKIMKSETTFCFACTESAAKTTIKPHNNAANGNIARIGRKNSTRNLAHTLVVHQSDGMMNSKNKWNAPMSLVDRNCEPDSDANASVRVEVVQFLDTLARVAPVFQIHLG